MSKIFFDTNFYILLTFVGLLLFVLKKYKGTVSSIFKKKIEKISQSINEATCEKEKALLALTKANHLTINLPDDIAKIWEEYSIDVAFLQENVDSEVNVLEKASRGRLNRLMQIKVQKDYYRLVNEICEKFRFEVQIATYEEKQQLLQKSISWLDNVELPKF